MRGSCIALFVLGAAACGGDPGVEATAATLSPVRGAVVVGDREASALARVAPGEVVTTPAGGLARLALDGGAGALLGEGAVTVDGGGRVTVRAGHAFVETRGDQVEVDTPGGLLRTRDAGFSVVVEGEAAHVYVVRGEVGWAGAGDDGRALGPGRRFIIEGGALREDDVALWEDWTHGWAEAGPAESARPVGVGTLEGRVPEEVGQARWPLVVRRLDVRVRVVDDLAITEVDQVFFNPASEALEGLYRIRVPEDAVLSRFAVDREGRLVDGYVRERAQAERAYTEQVYRGSNRDPALLEWDGPGDYRARIYPIRPGETRRIVVRYAEWLGASEGRRLYRYPMAGGERGPRVQELSIDVDLTEAGADGVRAGLGATLEDDVLRLRLSDLVPRSDFWVELDSAPVDTARAWRAPHVPPIRAPGARHVEGEAEERDYWLLPLALPADLATAPPAGIDVVVVADVSAATDRGALELGRGVVESLAAMLGDDDRLAVVGSDLALRPVGDDPPALGPVTDARRRSLLDGLARMRPGGASDLGEAITSAAGLLEDGRRAIVLYVGDGRGTVGERSAEALRARIAALPSPPRLYAIGAGPDADMAALGGLVRGGGRALHVRERREATDAALDVLAHARRPVAHRVEVELGDTVTAVFPRGGEDLVLGDVLPVVGRLDGDPPSRATIRGVIAGAPFERTLELETGEAPDGTDLRLRWASARLDELIAEDASREVIVELGVRHGLITPHTSFYVPSAQELREMGILATRLIDAPTPSSPRGRSRPSPLARGALAVLLVPLTIAGCEGSADRAAEPYANADRPIDPSRVTLEPAPGSASTPPSVPAPVAAEPEPEPAEEADYDDRPSRARRAPRPTSTARPDAPNRPSADRGAMAATVRGVVAGCLQRAGGGSGTVSVSLDASGRVTSASYSGSGGAAVASCVQSGLRGMQLGGPGGPRSLSVAVSVAGGAPLSLAQLQTAQIVIELTRAGIHADAHTARPCSDAAELPLDERRELWRERLEHGQSWPAVRAVAIADCEARSWRERRALIDAILAHAGGVWAMINVATQLSSDAERAFARERVLARVRSAEDVRAVRGAFGEEVGAALIDQVLDRARTPEARARALRGLVAQYPRDFSLRLRLVAALDGLARHAEASRLQERMRADPLADPTVRTAIGERLLARGQPEEARRAFSEIVEFAPLDALARRRVGDLYRAHGWHQAAYRQYQTLQDLTPDDPGVLLLLARAAAGAGRVDEALRLEARVAETQAGAGQTSLGRVAQLWSSVRYARLLHDAGADEERREQLAHRRRRSSVLRGGASAVRVTLTFAHPDAGIYLLAGMPGLRPSRPTDIAPEHGIEAFDLPEQEPGLYPIEVRRTEEQGPPIDAELVVVWNEGQRDEQIEVVPLRFEPTDRVRAFRLEGRTFAPAPPAD